MSTGKQPSVSGQSISGKKRVWVEFQEDTAVAEVAATVNQSATTCAGRLLAIQKTRDDEALASAREERKAKSARVFEGDAGLSEGVKKVQEQIKKLKVQLSKIDAALADSLKLSLDLLAIISSPVRLLFGPRDLFSIQPNGTLCQCSIICDVNLHVMMPRFYLYG